MDSGCWALAVDWNMMAESFGSVAQGFAALIAALAALLGVGAWRIQLHGTKRQALAEECLTSAYQLQYAIEDLRRPAAWGSEMNQVKRGPDESEEDLRARVQYGVVEVRFAAYASDFSSMVASRFRLQTVLGKGVRDSFENLLNKVTLVRNAAIEIAGNAKYLEFLCEQSKERGQDHPSLSAVKSRNLKLRGIIWAGATPRPDEFEVDGPDEFEAEVKALVADLEARLRDIAAGGAPTLRGRLSQLLWPQ